MRPLFRCALTIGLTAGLIAAPQGQAQTPRGSSGGAGGKPVPKSTGAEQVESSAKEKRNSARGEDPARAGMSLQSIMRDAIAGDIKSIGLMALLRLKPVQQDLGLSPRQIGSIQRVVKQATKHHVELDKLSAELAEKEAERVRREGNQGTKLFDPQASKEEVAALIGLTDEALFATLKPSQWKRLEQIALQARGPLAVLTDPEVMGWLGIRPDQEERIALVLSRLERQKQGILAEGIKLWQEANAKRGRPMGTEIWERMGVSKDVWVKSNKIQAHREAAEQEAVREVGKILTDSQKRRYRSLVGPPFDFSKLAEPPSARTKRDGKKPAPEQPGAGAPSTSRERDGGLQKPRQPG